MMGRIVDMSYEIADLRKSVEDMRNENEQNVKNKEKFEEYLRTQLEGKWDTTHSREAIEDLKNFITKDFQEYIEYINKKLNAFESVVIPGLERIENA